ncbi:MAG: DUF2235 domain-containing protein [Mycolicibacterium cosmeticum]|nr:DUF2235 domain-containing protein [Mycolicibacterium cosmeticum]
MTKSLVICCDGTWNTPDQKSPTNVTKMALALADVDDRGREQRVFYHQGVGSSPRERLRGGAFGFGLSRDVRDAYRFLVQNYDPGDRLYFFGFSRGAFTARSTAGFVRNCGILRRQEEGRIDEAYKLYRDRNKHPRSLAATIFRRSYSYESRIRFIGVWDTVGALGVPVDGLHVISWLNRRWQFHDTDLSTTVDAAFHAVSIDEQRGPFRPTLWSQQSPPPEGQVVEQVWFSGAHCDVGGGSVERSLSDIPLLWMAHRAGARGLSYREDAFTRCSASDPLTAEEATRAQICVAPHPNGAFEDSRKGLYRWIGPFHRKIGAATRGHESVASSAVFRHSHFAGYAPGGLVDYLRRPDHRETEVGGVPDRRLDDIRV